MESELVIGFCRVQNKFLIFNDDSFAMTVLILKCLYFIFIINLK